jgi:ATP-binding cassette subfamily C protein
MESTGKWWWNNPSWSAMGKEGVLMNRQKKPGLFSLTRRLLRRALPERGLLVLSTIASVAGNVSQLGLMGFGAMLLLRCAGYTASGPHVMWGALTLFCAGMVALCRYWEGYLSHAAAYRLLSLERTHMYRVLRRLAPARLMDRQKGDILSVALSDIETIEFFFGHTIGSVITVILLPVITLAIAGSNHMLFVWALLPVYLVMSILLPLLAMRTGRGIGMLYRERLGAMKSLVLESVYGLRDIQIYGFASKRGQIIRAQNDAVNRSTHLLTLHRQIVTSAPVFFVHLARILLLAIASYLALRGENDPIRFILLSFIVSASFSSTQSLTTIISSLLETFAAAERIFALEDARPAVSEAPDAQELDGVKEIRFERVSFRYEKSGEKILDGLDLTITRGEKLGIMGESGAGKSTILRLLLRFWDPESGRIVVDGVPLTRVSAQSLRTRVALLEQDTFLFNGSIAANIAFGKENATRDEVVEAAKRAQIHDFILTLPDGYETEMGEMGSRLSGGEKQRIGIARIMLIDPDVLIMDEPTSNLDILNEKGFLKTLSDAYGEKTIVIVSHRASTLAGCDRVLVLKDGKLSERRQR